jgi:predicted PurR-regulated permease PerM
LAVIFLIYLGMKFFGLTGIVFTPIIVITLRAVLRVLKVGQVRGSVKDVKIRF